MAYFWSVTEIEYMYENTCLPALMFCYAILKSLFVKSDLFAVEGVRFEIKVGN